MSFKVLVKGGYRGIAVYLGGGRVREQTRRRDTLYFIIGI